MLNTFAILDLSTPDLLIILAIVLLLFGSQRLPELARSLGSTARELKNGLGEMSSAGHELKQQVADVTASPRAAALAASDQPVGPLNASAARSTADGLIGGRRLF